MRNRFYQRARRAESEACQQLLKENCEIVLRGAGSKSKGKYKVDLVGLKYQQGKWLARPVQIKTCRSQDLNKYKREKEQGIELWIKVLQKGWEKL